MTIQLFIKDPHGGTGRAIGKISDEQLRTLIELLEEEDEGDRDYFVDRDLLAYLEQEGAQPELLALLRPHLTGDEGFEIEWRKED